MTGRPFVASLAASAVLLAGCGAAGQTSANGAGQQGAQAHQKPVSKLRVGLTEWEIVTSAKVVEPGRVHITVTNTGATDHDLDVRGKRGTWHTPHLSPGERDQLVVRAAPGETLSLWCDITGHAAEGMRTTLTVAR